MDGLPARAYAAITDASEFGEWAYLSYRAYANSLFIAFEEHAITGLNTHRPADLAGYGDLALARNFRLFLHFLTVTWVALLRTAPLRPKRASV